MENEIDISIKSVCHQDFRALFVTDENFVPKNHKNGYFKVSPGDHIVFSNDKRIEINRIMSIMEENDFLFMTHLPKVEKNGANTKVILEDSDKLEKFKKSMIEICISIASYMNAGGTYRNGFAKHRGLITDLIAEFFTIIPDEYRYLYEKEK